jgi:hypothetical protein
MNYPRQQSRVIEMARQNIIVSSTYKYEASTLTWYLANYWEWKRN